MRYVLLLALVALVVAAAAPSATRRPALRLVERAPLTVAGSGFAAQELVRLTLVGAAETPRLARASAAGRFRLVLRASLDACPRPVAVTARGSRGSRASLPLAGGACVPPPRS